VRGGGVTLYRFRCPDCGGQVRWKDLEHGHCDDCGRDFADFRDMTIYKAEEE
jgi:hypothetical protein